MRSTWYRFQSAVKYGVTARHRKGFGVHSPFVFDLLNHVVFTKEHYYCYDEIERWRNKLFTDDTPIKLQGCGTAGPRTLSTRQIAKKSGEPARYAQLLFRLALSNNSKTIFELGTSLGLTSLYLSNVGSTAKIYTFELETELIKFTKKTFEHFHRYNINIIEGDIDENLDQQLAQIEQLDFAFFDANHTREATLRYFEKCLSKAHSKTIFVFDDIYWSEGMEQAWKQIIANPKVTVSLDIYRMGVVFFDPDLNKRNYIVAF
ncbi:MAG: class I SAM-dependent methyltransferase [Bacteroidales bacterium]|nr:class I SAM-dependent methyltransferase [Bacteroidales bacterium]